MTDHLLASPPVPLPTRNPRPMPRPLPNLARRAVYCAWRVPGDPDNGRASTRCKHLPLTWLANLGGVTQSPRWWGAQPRPPEPSICGILWTASLACGEQYSTRHRQASVLPNDGPGPTHLDATAGGVTTMCVTIGVARQHR
eukprot:scaffold32710_cov33-Tisochrysis_lutea.AAC.2